MSAKCQGEEILSFMLTKQHRYIPKELRFAFIARGVFWLNGTPFHLGFRRQSSLISGLYQCHDFRRKVRLTWNTMLVEEIDRSDS